jgi:hypothetical protein
LVRQCGIKGKTMTARAVLLAGAAALLPVSMAAAVAEVTTDVQLNQFAPPTTPLVLTRTLYRTLGDGKVLIVTRRYAIRFTAVGDGFRLDGEQIGAEVEGLFPASLDQSGMIRQGGIAASDPAMRKQVVTQANAVIAGADLAAPAKREGVALVGQLAATPNNTAWPVFLFNPGLSERIETRRVPLADGSEGQVEVRVRAEGIVPGGLPHRVERIVTTRLAGTEKVSREVWTIAPAAP